MWCTLDYIAWVCWGICTKLFCLMCPYRSIKMSASNFGGPHHKILETKSLVFNYALLRLYGKYFQIGTIFVIDHCLLIHTSSGLGHPFPMSPPYFPFPFTPSVVDPCPTLPVTETAVAGGARPEAYGRRGLAFSLVSLPACWINNQTIQRSIAVLGGALNSAQSNQSFAVESIVMTKLLFRVNAWLIMRNPLNRLYKHTMRLVLSFVCLLIGSGDGSTLIICRRAWGRVRMVLSA